MNNKYIAVFDSGIGGLTVVKEIIDLLPNENIIYFGDTINVPYGEKTIEQIKQFASNNINFLKQYPCKAFVVACGTMDANAHETMDKLVDEPLFGVIGPACKKAASLTRNNKVGIIATPASINSKAYINKLLSINPSIEVYDVACYKLATLIEQGHFTTSDNETIELLKRYLLPLKKENIDTLILGCTHYPLVKKLIEDILPNVNIVSCSYEEALEVKDYLQSSDNLANKHSENKYFVSSDPEQFKKIAKVFIDIKEEVKLK